MSESIDKIESSKADPMTGQVDNTLKSQLLGDIEEVTVNDFQDFDFESFVTQNSEQINEVLKGLQTENSLESIDIQTSSDPLLGPFLSDYLISDDEDFGNKLMSDLCGQTSSHCSHTYSSQSMSSSTALTATQQTIGQPLIESSACSHRSEETLLPNQNEFSFDFDSDVLDTSLEVQSKPVIIDLKLSKTYRRKKKGLLKRARTSQGFEPSHGSVNVGVKYLKRITEVNPSLLGLIKMGAHSERKTGTKGSSTGPYVHRMTVLSGVVTINIDSGLENKSFILKVNQMIKIGKTFHYFITNSESKEAILYFKVSLK